MASATGESPEVEQHYLTQAAIGSWASQQVGGLAEALEPDDLAASFAAFAELAGELIAPAASASIDSSADFYADLRSGSGVRDSFRAPMIEPPSLERISVRLAGSTAELLEATRVVPDEIYLANLTAQIIAEAEGIAAAIVADSAREQIIEAANLDPASAGWVRVTRVGACSFCRMLAMRGPVFSYDTAEFRAHVPKDGRGGTCKCAARPQFGPFEATAQARSDEGTWERVTAEGFAGADARYEFRRRLEGRADGRRLRVTSDPVPTLTPAQRVAGRSGFDLLTVSQLELQLQVMAPLKESEWKTKQTARVRARLSELANTSPA